MYDLTNSVSNVMATSCPEGRPPVSSGVPGVKQLTRHSCPALESGECSVGNRGGRVSASGSARAPQRNETENQVRASSRPRPKQTPDPIPNAWRVQDRFLPNNPCWLSQTANGYLWVGSAKIGFLRFDGVRLFDGTPRPGKSCPPRSVPGDVFPTRSLRR